MKYEQNQDIIGNINRWNMEIGESAYVYLNKDSWNGNDICSQFSRLYLISSGQGYLDTGGRRIILEPGYAYFVPAGLTFDYGCDNYMEKLYFHLHLIKPNGYDLADGLSFIAKCALEKDYLDKMHRHYNGNRWEDVLLLEQEIRIITLKLLRQYNILQETPITYSALTEEAMRYIQANLSAGMSTKQVADALFISDNTLARRFRQETGKTIHRYIEDMVFRNACKRLTDSDLSLREISDELGFCDSFYFSRRFRERYGEPPSHYRKRLKYSAGN
ncbi:MAG: helix-turn-helix transcriptional regulator [Lachnospiraceae bacterium]|nr:helix-turn-helix transcriptional regulator [Lachnospiraceae bacterium]